MGDTCAAIFAGFLIEIKMSDDEFLACIREIGSECGIKREDINENNAFVGYLGVSFAEIATVIFSLVF